MNHQLSLFPINHLLIPILFILRIMMTNHHIPTDIFIILTTETNFPVNLSQITKIKPIILKKPVLSGIKTFPGGGRKQNLFKTEKRCFIYLLSQRKQSPL